MEYRGRGWGFTGADGTVVSFGDAQQPTSAGASELSMIRSSRLLHAGTNERIAWFPEKRFSLIASIAY